MIKDYFIYLQFPQMIGRYHQCCLTVLVTLGFQILFDILGPNMLL